MNFLAAALYTVAGSVLIAVALGFQNHGLAPSSAWLALSGGLLIGALGWWRGRRTPRLPRPGGWAIFALVLFALFSFRAFLWLIFRDGDQLSVLSPNNLGDMSLHLTFIRYFANGAPFWPDSPIFAAGKLTYAAGMDLFNALLTLIGVDTVRGLIWVGLLGSFGTALALTRWGGAFTTLGFLFNGGLAAVACFFAAHDTSIFRDWQAQWAWKSIPLAILVTQRGFLFALPAGLLLLTSWRTRFLRDGDGWKMPFLGELLLYAAMPVFHMHTFLVLSFILAAILIARRTSRAQVARLIAAAFLPATVLCWLTVGMLKTNAEPLWDDMGQFENPPRRPPLDALGWQPGWMVNDTNTAETWRKISATAPGVKNLAPHGKFLVFWIGNFGILPLLLVPMLVLLLRPVFPRGPSQPVAWACLAGFVVITPFLGMWSAYQTKSLGALLTGGTGELGLRTLAIPLLALIPLVAALRLRQSRPHKTASALVLFSIAGLLLLDTLLTVMHARNPLIPLIRANALPLLLATLAFCAFLLRCARQRVTYANDANDTQQRDIGWPTLMGIPALFLFFICCNVRFANWEWDNTKLMIWSLLIVLPVLWETLISRWPLWSRALVCSLLFFSGFLSVFGGIGTKFHGYGIAQLSTLDAIEQAVRDIPITEAFASHPTYNHPLLLCGRKVVMGFPGHLGSHGIQYGPVDDELGALMLGHSDWRLRAARLGVRYLYFGPGERKAWPLTNESWRMGATVIASGEWGEILDLHTPPLPVSEEEPAAPRMAPPRLQLPSAPR